MGKSKALTVHGEQAVEPSSATQNTNVSPYQLDQGEVERAAKALVAHMKKDTEEKGTEAAVKNLADDEDEAEENEQPIFLSVSTKKHIHESNSLKPSKMSVCAS